MRLIKIENTVGSACFSLMLFYSSSGILMPFLPAWIKANSYNEQEVAFIMSACMFSRAFMILIAGNFLSKFSSLGSSIKICSLLTAMIFFVLPFIRCNYAAMAALLILGSGLIFSLMPLIEQQGISATRTQPGLYGNLRAYGSAAYLICNVLTGLTLSESGFIFTMPFSVATIFLMLSLRAHNETEFVCTKKVLPASSVRLMLYLIPAFFIFASNAYYYSFGVLRWIDAGIAPHYTGILWATGVIFEVLAFRYFSLLTRRYSPTAIFLVCALCSAVRWYFSAYNLSFGMNLILQIGHAFSFALVYATSMKLISDYVPTSGQRKAQINFAFITSCVSLGGGMALIPIVRNFSTIDPFFIMGILCLLSIVSLIVHLTCPSLIKTE